MIRLSVVGCAAFVLFPSPTRDSAPPPRPIPLPLTVLQGTVQPRSTLGALFKNTLSPSVVDGLVKAARPVYDLARVSIGHPFPLTLGPQGILAAFTYGID